MKKQVSDVSLKLRQLEFTPAIVSSLKPAYHGLNLDRGRSAFLKAFANKIACEEVEDIFKSEVIFIAGPSGAGKQHYRKIAARIMEEKRQERPTLVSAESELVNGRDDLSYYSKLLNLQKLNYKIDENCRSFANVC